MQTDQKSLKIQPTSTARIQLTSTRHSVYLVNHETLSRKGWESSNILGQNTTNNQTQIHTQAYLPGHYAEKLAF